MGQAVTLSPSVTLVCLVADRDEMLERAIRCWQSQSYACNLLIYDNGAAGGIYSVHKDKYWQHTYAYDPRKNRTIGELRNAANMLVQTDIIAHLDSDDISHPRRMEEQVALLQFSGADVVGYSDMLFWDTRKSGEAWLYRSDPGDPDILGTSLCYWRKTWERQPFKHTSQGEDIRFCDGLKVRGVSSLPVEYMHDADGMEHSIIDPRMIATIHGGNTSNAYTPGKMAKREWTRAPEWEEYCRKIY